MTHSVWPCPADGFARPLLLGVFALPSAVRARSSATGSAMPESNRRNWHRLVTTTAPISRLKTISRQRSGTLSACSTVNTGTSSAVQRFRGSEVQRFRGSMLAPRVVATMAYACTGQSSDRNGDSREMMSGAPPPAALGNRRGSPAWRQGQDGPGRNQNSFTLLWPRALNRAGVRVSMLL